jgi:ureidoglycolate lyase
MATATTVLVREAEKLVRTIALEVQPMTREAFAPYGAIVGERGAVELELNSGTASVIAETVESRPFEFDFLGRHLRTEQVFVPLGGALSVIAVALSDIEHEDLPDVRKMAAFLVDGSFAFKLHRGTWHTSAFPMQERASFWIINRESTLDQDYDWCDLKTTLGVVVEIRS